jgi:cell division protease FtsH
MSQEKKKRAAYHETGHALIALSVQHSDPVHGISIIPRLVSALGYTLQLPTHERFLMTQPELEDRLAVMLGGRAAEEIIYNGVISTGASDDLEKASELVAPDGDAIRHERPPRTAHIWASLDFGLFTECTHG